MFNSVAFNNDIYVQYEIARIISKYNIKTFIETGTFKGNTTFFMADYVEKVISIEANKPFYDDVNSRNTKQNVDLKFGNSGELLENVLQEQPKDNILFYLDAHWYNYWPLKDELLIIAKYKKNNCIIVIDDFQVPDRSDIQYDGCGELVNNYEYIKDNLDLIYPDGYDYYYLNKFYRGGLNTGVGKIYIFPKKWDCSRFYEKNQINGINYSNLIL